MKLPPSISRMIRLCEHIPPELQRLSADPSPSKLSLAAAPPDPGRHKRQCKPCVYSEETRVGLRGSSEVVPRWWRPSSGNTLLTLASR